MDEGTVKVRELLMSETLPKKNFFKLSEVATLLSVKPHEIHYWETEFPQIRSQKSHGQRVFRKDDVILFSAIKHLLYDRKFTVAGARRVLAESDIMSKELAAAKKVEATPINVVATPINEVAPIEIPSPELPMPQVQASEVIEVCDVLMEASHMLKDEEPEDVYDVQTHDIYQDCAQDLEQEIEPTIEPQHAGEMLSDALVEHKETKKQQQRLSALEKEQAMATLLASKQSLTDVITSLDKISPSDFWRGF